MGFPIFVCDEWALPHLRQWSWHGQNREGYLVCTMRGQKVSMHRYVWFLRHGEWPNIIDHINGVRQDNRIDNLRSVSIRENTGHRISPRKHRLPCGVSLTTSGRYRAQIRVDGKLVSLGTFPTPDHAADAYSQARAAINKAEGRVE